MNKLLLITFFVVVAANVQAKRDISRSTYYYECSVERSSAIAGDTKSYQKEVNFPVPNEKGEEYNLKKTARWNLLKMSINDKGSINLSIEENGEFGVVNQEKSFKIDKFDPYNPPAFTKNLMLETDKGNISYQMSCK